MTSGTETNVTRERELTFAFSPACVEPITGVFHTLWEFPRWLWRGTRFGKGQRRSCWFIFLCVCLIDRVLSEPLLQTEYKQNSRLGFIVPTVLFVLVRGD